ncbi:hypothetical protein GCM10028803_07930 [Larkinella knui]|uniref:hypothetical protein n=1 Tax=Larkinella knui TaxID=2025310 RepID=UPI00163A9159|nr:hypothetical protein [Larkinella knui]
MKTLNILIGLLGFAILITLYSGVTTQFSTERQAFIAGGLTLPAVGMLILVFIKSRQIK